MSQSQTPPHLFLSTLLLLAIVATTIISIHASAAQDWKMREEDDDSSNDLLGVEAYCKEGTEECLKGRMMHEAHLDYIYTQHHPKP